MFYYNPGFMRSVPFPLCSHQNSLTHGTPKDRDAPPPVSKSTHCSNTEPCVCDNTDSGSGGQGTHGACPLRDRCRLPSLIPRLPSHTAGPRALSFQGQHWRFGQEVFQVVSQKIYLAVIPHDPLVASAGGTDEWKWAMVLGTLPGGPVLWSRPSSSQISASWR